MQDSSLHSVANTQIFNGHITEEIIYQEFVKMGMQDFVANELSKRYYRNELTYKDIEYLESNFNLKFEMLERSLKSEIISVRTELDNKIDIVRNELKSDIKDLDNKIDSVESNLNVKIDTKFNELDNKIDIVESNLNVKIDNVRNELKSDIKDLDNKIDSVRAELKSDVASVSNEISLVRKDMEINRMEFKSTSKLHNWMFGTLITLNIGIFLALMSLLVK
ncbi:Bdr family repetitive protein [Borrelia turicatae]|uniref:Borrelia Direct Repeat protein 13 n=1 Tax=Borrelia turicatae (strain 91E135) TaxID=314724 RepID=A0ABF7QZW8_BORT9|nr:Bdr family repetitive protein [Borrelia turicatae]ASJ27678.1 Borrelia Direct Repeat protein 13 [Borrelia turicatae 91E135]